eukprot:1804347-Pleurochrysis_carterae.AAC.2
MRSCSHVHPARAHNLFPHARLRTHEPSAHTPARLSGALRRLASLLPKTLRSAESHKKTSLRRTARRARPTDLPRISCARVSHHTVPPPPAVVAVEIVCSLQRALVTAGIYFSSQDAASPSTRGDDDLAACAAAS